MKANLEAMKEINNLENHEVNNKSASMAAKWRKRQLAAAMA
jgi:hypothetical protein